MGKITGVIVDFKLTGRLNPSFISLLTKHGVEEEFWGAYPV